MIQSVSVSRIDPALNHYPAIDEAGFTIAGFCGSSRAVTAKSPLGQTQWGRREPGANSSPRPFPDSQGKLQGTFPKSDVAWPGVAPAPSNRSTQNARIGHESDEAMSRKRHAPEQIIRTLREAEVEQILDNAILK